MADNDKAPPKAANRRVSDRHFACFPSLIGTPADGVVDDRIVMICDVSVTGARLFTRNAEVLIGQRLDLDIFSSDDPKAPPRPVVAHVVRVEELDFQGLWTHSVAVKFDKPLTDFEAEIKAIAARQAKLFPKK
jgi:hypothetical protein